MALTGISKDALPRRSAGQTSVPEDEQAALLELVGSGQAASNGQSYASSKAAAQAAGPYLRFLRARIKAGVIAGKPRQRTFVTKRDKEDKPSGYGWAVSLD